MAEYAHVESWIAKKREEDRLRNDPPALPDAIPANNTANGGLASGDKVGVRGEPQPLPKFVPKFPAPGPLPGSSPAKAEEESVKQGGSEWPNPPLTPAHVCDSMHSLRSIKARDGWPLILVSASALTARRCRCSRREDPAAREAPTRGRPLGGICRRIAGSYHKATLSPVGHEQPGRGRRRAAAGQASQVV